MSELSATKLEKSCLDVIVTLTGEKYEKAMIEYRKAAAIVQNALRAQHALLTGLPDASPVQEYERVRDEAAVIDKAIDEAWTDLNFTILAIEEGVE